MTEKEYREKIESLQNENEKCQLENIKIKIASEYKLPDTALEFIQGNNENELRTQAEKLKMYIENHNNNYVMPSFTNEPNVNNNNVDEAYKGLAKQVTINKPFLY